MSTFFLEEIIGEFLKNVSDDKKNRYRRDLLRIISEIKKISYDNLFFSFKNFSINEEEQKKLNEFSLTIDDIEKKYEESLNNYFMNFGIFFSIIKNLKTAFSSKFY